MPAERTPSATDLPEFVGRYRVIERIGRGAMGVVYAALDEQMGRRVAVKVLLGDLEEDPEIRERFMREARITGQLAHRNVVTVYDLGEDRGRLFLVMELIDGMPLTEYLRTPAAQTITAKIDLMMQMCQGLQSAHSREVVHRDIKPSNLFVQRDGTLKILDFGVARLASSDLTVAGLLIGTPEYMSPEQTKGLTVDARSDIFSAAAVFHFMLAGRSPFGARGMKQTLHAILNEPPPALSDAQAPEPVRQVLARALAKSPNDRYQNCADLIADLDRAGKANESATRRIVQAALDRYRQTEEVIAERRALGRALGLPDADAAAQTAEARLAERFPWLAARAADAGAAIEPIARVEATEALEALQVRHNAELAALATLRAQTAQAPAASRAGTPGSWRSRAATFWRNLHSSGD